MSFFALQGWWRGFSAACITFLLQNLFILSVLHMLAVCLLKAGAFGEMAAFSGLSYLINSFLIGLFEKAIVWWSIPCLWAEQCLSNSLLPFSSVASLFSKSNWKAARLTVRSEKVPFLTFHTLFQRFTLRVMLRRGFPFCVLVCLFLKRHLSNFDNYKKKKSYSVINSLVTDII